MSIINRHHLSLRKSIVPRALQHLSHCLVDIFVFLKVECVHLHLPSWRIFAKSENKLESETILTITISPPPLTP
ncbi:hypothetical protein YC2023_032629 [Brassica napus]